MRNVCSKADGVSGRALRCAAGGGLRDGEQVRREIRFPAGQQPLLAGLAGAEAVVAVSFRDARQSAAGRVPVGADAFKREAMALGGLPIDAAKADPLRGGARRGPEQAGQRFQHLRIGRETLDNRIGAAQA